MHEHARRRFKDAYTPAVAFCALFSKAISVAAIVLRDRGQAIGILSMLVMGSLLVLRVWAHSAANQRRAREVFEWGWCAIFFVASVGITVAHQRSPLIGRVTIVEFGLAALLHLLFAFFQHYCALPSGPRLITLSTIALTHASWWAPPFSELGQPREGLIICIALLAGELLGLLLEARRRQVTGATSASGGTPSVRLLTLRFVDSALEGPYAAHVFGEGYPVVFATAISQIAFLGLLAIAVPVLTLPALAMAACVLTLLAVRVELCSAADQARARARFGRYWCALWSLTGVLLAVFHRRYILSTGMSATAFYLMCGAPARLELATCCSRAPGLLTRRL